MSPTGSEAASVRGQVNRILASKGFLGSERMIRFLRFVVEETLEGRGDQIKEYVIGVEVYGKASYDPRTDSTVRVEASKLRTKLRKYYEDEGRNDELLISIPKGSYVAVFERRQSPPGPARTGRRLALAGMAGVLVAFGAGLWWWKASRSGPEPLPRVVPLTSFRGNEFHPSFSPDGNQVAFYWNGEKLDNYDIYVQMVGGAHPVRLTTHPAWDGRPVWSPDGRTIAFIRRAGEELSAHLVSPLGGQERELAKVKGVDVAWTADAQRLAVIDRDSPGEPLGIFLVSIATGEKRRLTLPGDPKAGDSYPAFSPDGRSVAFFRCSTGRGCSICIAPGSGTPAAAQTHCRQTGASDPAGMVWTPNGRVLVFGCNRGGGYGLWRMAAGPGFLRAEPVRVAGVEEPASFPSIGRDSRGGLRLAFQRIAIDLDIWRLDAPGATPTRLIASTRWDIAPQFSPDGRRIAFASDRSGSMQVWACDDQGANPMQLTSLGVAASSPRWSPDGRRIVFESSDGANRDIYWVAAEGGPPHRLTSEHSEETRPSWSADGRWVYFRSDRSGTPQIWKMPAQGGGAVQVTRNRGSEAFEAQDGKRLYYANESGVWSVATDGTGPESLVLAAARPGYWAVAGKGIYFVDFTPPVEAPAIRVLDLGTGQATPIGHFPSQPFRGVPGFSVSRDGRRVLWAQLQQYDSDLMVLENFR
ncbi:MAG: PD40 domain-containing protein [Acidobacteria bacterium]|nr:PD40 domain-containing protein [Acidobacteriota bacterium]